LDENRECPNCHNSYHSIIDKQNGAYTLAYEPIGFRTDQNVDSTRQERTEKRFYDIRPVLLKSDWSSPMKDVSMCEVITSGEIGEILFYNVGNGHGFALCKHCGRAVVETMAHNKELPHGIKLGHNRLWGDACDANTSDIARHVVFTGRHQTCYSVIRVKSTFDSDTYEKDKELAREEFELEKQRIEEQKKADIEKAEASIKAQLEADKKLAAYTNSLNSAPITNTSAAAKSASSSSRNKNQNANTSSAAKSASSSSRNKNQNINKTTYKSTGKAAPVPVFSNREQAVNYLRKNYNVSGASLYSISEWSRRKNAGDTSALIKNTSSYSQYLKLHCEYLIEQYSR
jgi:hypothetical protein